MLQSVRQENLPNFSPCFYIVRALLASKLLYMKLKLIMCPVLEQVF